MFRVDNLTSLFQQSYKLLVLLNSGTINTVVKYTVPLVLLLVVSSMKWSRAVFCQSYYLQEWRFTGQEQCVVSPIFLQDYSCTSQDLPYYRYSSPEQCVASPTSCRTTYILIKSSVSLVLPFCRSIDILVKTSVSLVLLFVGLSIHQPRLVYRQSYFFVRLSIQQSRTVNRQSYFSQDYLCSGQEQCVICRTIDTLVKVIVSLILLFVGLSKRQCCSYSSLRKAFVQQKLLFDSQVSDIFGHYTLFFISYTFISNAMLQLAKNQANAKQRPEVELLLFENYSHPSSTLSSKNNRRYP